MSIDHTFEPDEQREIDLEFAKSQRRLYPAVTFIVILGIILLVSWYAFDLILLTFAGILLAIFLRTGIIFLRSQFGFSEGLSFSIAVIAFLLFLGLAIGLSAPHISNQIGELVTKFPHGWNIVENYFRSYLNEEHISQATQDASIANLFPKDLNLLEKTTTIFSSTLGIIASFFLFLAVGIYVAYDPMLYMNGFIKLFPLEKRARVQFILFKINEILSWWIFGKVIAMFVIGVLTTIGLLILGAPLAATLGLLAALMAFIPTIGPIIAAVPAILIAFVKSPILAFYVLILYIVLQSLESYLITPYIERRTISLPPAITLIVQLLMGIIAGLLGLALAAPLAAVVLVLVKMIYIEDIIEDKT